MGLRIGPVFNGQATKYMTNRMFRNGVKELQHTLLNNPEKE
jgi:hypothetical protein